MRGLLLRPLGVQKQAGRIDLFVGARASAYLRWSCP